MKGKKSLSTIYNSKKPTKAGLSSWLRKSLGYDAVVLDKNGSFILAGLVSKISKKSKKSGTERLQGLLLKNTQKKFYVRSKKGAALLQLLNTYKGYGLCEVVVE